MTGAGRIATLPDLFPRRFQLLPDQTDDPVTVEGLGGGGHILIGKNTVDAGEVAKLHLPVRILWAGLYVRRLGFILA